MLTRQQKEEVVRDLGGRLAKQHITLLSDFRGISVAALQSLRRNLRDNEAEYKVVRKTLFDRALADCGIQLKTKEEMKGQVGVVFGYGDEVAPARVLAKFKRENETFQVLGGVLGGSILSTQQVLALAKLPAREVLLGQLAMVLQAPIRNLAVVLQANIRNLAVVLGKLQEQKGSSII